MLLNLAEDWLKSSGAVMAGNVTEWMTIGLAIWMPVYLLISLRHVYQQKWFFTFCKFGVIGLSYITLLGLVTSIVAILSFVLL